VSSQSPPSARREVRVGPGLGEIERLGDDDGHRGRLGARPFRQVRATGLLWVNGFAVRRKVSVPIGNKETPTVEVNAGQ
jgi:hypothetical protein